MKLAPLYRTLNFVLVGVLVTTVVWTFKVKHDSQTALDQVRELQRQVEAEKVEIDLLKSDWSLLTSPARLEQLVKRYETELSLKPMRPTQISKLTELPALTNTAEQALADDASRTGDALDPGPLGIQNNEARQ